MNEEITKVATKLLKARNLFHSKQITKTGKNEFAKYLYFELSDFLPQALAAFGEVGLVGVVSFTRDDATLLIVDTESGERLPVTSPMSEASLRGCHAVQNLGAVQTYLRRYLWAATMELVEGDPVDSAPPAENAKEQVGPTPRAKPPVEAPKTPPRAPQRQETASAGNVEWRGHLIEVKPVSGQKANGEEYLFYSMKMTTNEGKQVEATTFDEDRHTEASFWPKEDEVIMVAKPRLGKADKFNFVGLKQIEE